MDFPYFLQDAELMHVCVTLIFFVTYFFFDKLSKSPKLISVFILLLGCTDPQLDCITAYTFFSVATLTPVDRRRKWIWYSSFWTSWFLFIIIFDEMQFWVYFWQFCMPGCVHTWKISLNRWDHFSLRSFQLIKL